MALPLISWTKIIGSSGSEGVYGISIGKSNNIIAIGETTGRLNGVSNSGGYDLFLTSFLTNGSLLWTSLNGSVLGESGNDTATSSDGSIYVVGDTLGSLDGISNSGSYDGFISKYNSSGLKVWTKLIGSSAQDRAWGVSTAIDGSIYVVGHTDGPLDKISNITSQDGFITKFNSAGDKLWTRTLGSTSRDAIWGSTIGNDGSIYVGGTTSGNFDGQSSSGSTDIFVSKYSSDGVKQWTRIFGTTSFENSSGNLITGQDGNIYISGSTDGNLNGQLNAGGADAFLTKIDTNGALIWTRLIGTSGIDRANTLALGLDGYIFIAGSTNGSLDSQVNMGGTDIFVSKFSPSGVKSWTKQIGTSSNDAAYAAAVTNDGVLIIGGETYGNLNNQINSGGADGFLISLQDLTFTLSPQSISVNEGTTATFNLTTTNVESGSTIAYSLSGITVDDLLTNSLTGFTTVLSNGTATIGVQLKNDNLTEGSETLTINVGGKTSSILINDTSKNPSAFLNQNFPTLTSVKLIDNIISPISPAKLSFTINGTDAVNSKEFFFFRNITDPNKIIGFSGNGFSGTINNNDQISTISSGIYDLSFAVITDSIDSNAFPRDTIYYGGSYYSNEGNPIFQKGSSNDPKIGNYTGVNHNFDFQNLKLFAYTDTKSIPILNSISIKSLSNKITIDYSANFNSPSGEIIFFIQPLSEFNQKNISNPHYFSITSSNSSGQVSTIIPSDFPSGKAVVTALISSIGFQKEGAITTTYNSLLNDAWVAKYTNGSSVTLFNDTYLQDPSNFQFDYVQPQLTPTYSITSNNTSVNEGSTATFTLKTTNVVSGTSILYTLSGISSSDITGSTLSGYAIVNASGLATIVVPIAQDNLTEGTETLTVSLQGKNASTLINDTSKSAATYSLSANSTSVNEGATATFLLTTTNVAAGTSIGYNISGISVGDLSSGSLSGTTTVATNGQASITINLANDNLTEGTETLTVLAQGQTVSTLVNDTSKSNTSTFPTVLTQQQMQNAPALTFTAFNPTDPAIKWNFSSFFFGTNLLGKDFNPTSFYASASSIYDFNALSIDDPDYLGIFDSNGILITSSSEAKDWAAWVDSSGNSYDYDNISAWSPPKDGTYYLGVVLSQTSSTPFYSFGGYETRATVTSIPFGNGKYFYGSSGPDNVIGTSYVDVLKQTSNSASNQLTKLADGSWQVQNKLTPSNSDNLVNVERIEFSDMSVALDVSGPAGQVAKILGSVFGKSYVSNTVFAGIGFAYLDGGMSYLDLCGLAAGAAGLSTPDLLVTTLLRNTTGTEPTALSKSSYLTSISNGASYASVVQQIADSSANAQSIKLTDLANIGLAYTPYALPPTYSLSASTAFVNEGSTAVFNLTTTNVAVGVEVSYEISGVSPTDLTSGTLTGKVGIGVGGTASISIPIAADGATEGQESLTIIAQGATASIVINDTSKSIASPTYTLTPATTSINEGVLAQVYVSTTNVAAGTSLQFGISGVGITQGDVIEGLSRFVTVDSTGKAVININTVADQLTEGPETMFITLGTSTTSIIMNDTSVTLVGIPDGGGGDGGGSGGGGGGSGGGD
jgi:hypothetical protein